ncbi:MAG TPA: hypothetical protein VIV65_07995, partial [Gemmatimonadaceae bacterium]
MAVAGRTVPQALIDGIRNSDDAALQRGFKEFLPALVEETNRLGDNPPSVARIVENAVLKVITTAQPKDSPETIDAAFNAALKEAVTRDRSRRAAVQRFEHNEGVTAGGHAAAGGAIDADQLWTRIEHAREARKH